MVGSGPTRLWKCTRQCARVIGWIRSTKFEDYLNMLYSDNFLPLITKPTRLTDHSSTLIDRIYTNAPIENTTSGIALGDISDHLPVFCICNAPTSKNKHITYYRDYSNFCKEQYLA